MVSEVHTYHSPRRVRVWLGFGSAVIAALALFGFFWGALTAQGQAADPLLLAPTITKSSVTSIVDTNNTIAQAVAGELVTVTVVYNVPIGETIYDVSPRVVLADGLLPIGSAPGWAAMSTGTRDELRTLEGPGNVVARDGALVIFPDQGTITGTDIITMVVYAVRTQHFYVGTTEINHGTNLRVQAILRYCANEPGCTPLAFISNDTTVAQVPAIQPQVNTAYGATYLDPDGLGAGGGQVRLTFTASGVANRPTAYDIVYTATLGSGLTYVGSNGAGAGTGTVTTVGEVTYITWNVPGSLVAPQTWQAVVTATLPSTFTIGQEFPYQGFAEHETFPGVVPYMGRYITAGTAEVLRPGVSVTAKSSVPGSGAVTMGDRITYTLTFRQAPNTELQLPTYVDSLSRGFHYVSGTLSVEGATLLGHALEEGPLAGTGVAARYLENLRVNMATLPVTTMLRQVTVQYVALNTGLDFNGTPTWDTLADMAAARNTIEAGSVTNRLTGAMLHWTPPVGSTYTNLGGSYTDLGLKANSTAVNVIQPRLVNDQFAAIRTGSAPVNVGDVVLLTIRLRNSGATPGVSAHGLRVCDTIPDGFAYETTFSCEAVGGVAPCPAYTSPVAGSTGTICWTLDGLPRSANTGQYHEIKYQISVLPTAVPGMYTNRVSIEEFSSKAGVVEGERNYHDRIFTDNPIPTPVNCGAQCITVLGLAGDKQPWVTNVAPGELLTYTLRLTDTRATTAYNDVVVLDHYDEFLSFVSASPAPTSHDAGARELSWALGTLPVGGAAQIVLTMRVDSVIEGRYVLTNTMIWDSAQSEPFSVAKPTHIDVSALHLRMGGSATTYAGGPVVYTIVYSNTGSSSAPLTLTLDYDPNLNYVSATPLLPVPGTEGQTFTTVVPNDDTNKLLTITLTADAPLPYTLEELTSAVQLASPGAPVQTDDWTTTLLRPIFEFHKTGPTQAAALGAPMQYTFHLRNIGTYTATNLIITDTWDSATSFQTSPGWVLGPGGTYAHYTIAALAPGATSDIYLSPLTVQVDVLQDSYVNLADLSSTQTSKQSTQLRTWQRSIALAKTAYPTPAFPSRTLTYTLYFTNTSSSDGVVNAVITDTLPTGFVFAGQSSAQATGCQSPGWTFTYESQQAVWRCQSLLNGVSGHFVIWGQVTAAENTELVNEAVSSGLGIPLRPLDEPLRTLVARPRLRVNKVGAPTHSVAPGDVVTYTLTYENYGSYAAYGVVIKDQLPAQLTFAGCDSGCSHSAGLVTWNIGLLPKNTTGVVTVYATVNTGTHGQTAMNSNYTIENTAAGQVLTPAQTENGPTVNTVILNPQLTLTKAAGPTEGLAVNDTIYYTITYANTGGGLLHGIVLTDTLSAHTGFLSASAECQHVGGLTGGVVYCSVGNLANGTSREVYIQVAVATTLSAGTIIPNQAQGRAIETAPTASNITEVCYGACITDYYIYLPLVLRQ